MMLKLAKLLQQLGVADGRATTKQTLLVVNNINEAACLKNPQAVMIFTHRNPLISQIDLAAAKQFLPKMMVTVMKSLMIILHQNKTDINLFIKKDQMVFPVICTMYTSRRANPTAISFVKAC